MLQKISSLFEPDAILHTQYWETFVRKTHLEPEKMLMLAVLQDAIVCFQKHVLERNPLSCEEEDWILEENGNWHFSFKNICEVLELHPGYIRQGLLRWKEKRLAENRKISFMRDFDRRRSRFKKLLLIAPNEEAETLTRR